MKAIIKIKRLNKAIRLPEIINVGDWVDLRASVATCVGRQPVTYIPLGIAVKLPDGYEAIVASRSSTPKKMHIWNAGSIGIIDGSFCGNDDEWVYPATTIGCCETVIHQGERICQFRIQLSQKATMWQRIKWLFTSGIRIVEVDNLEGESRGGLGSTGAK